MADSTSEIVVIGVGQELRGDDGVGPRIVREWQRQHPGSASHARVETCPSPGLELLDLISEAAAVVLVDAVRSEASPGTVRILDPEQLKAFDNSARYSHGFGLAEVLALGQKTRHALHPDQIIILGLEAHKMELGVSLSPEVRAGIPAAVAKLEEVIQDIIS